MKIVLVGNNLRMTESSVPIGICSLASVLREKGHEVKIIDRTENPVEEIINFTPDLVGFSTTTSTYNRTVEWATELKGKMPILTVIGGSHITALQKLEPCFKIAT